MTQRVEYRDGASEVGAMGAKPVGDAALDRGNGGEVEAAVDAIDRLAHRDRFGDIAFDQLDLGWQIVAFASGEIVEDADAVALPEQRLAKVRADEAGAAGDEPCRHAGRSWLAMKRTPHWSRRSRASSMVVWLLPRGIPMPRQASSIITTS